MDQTRLFSVVPRNRTRGHWHKLEQRKFHIRTRVIQYLKKLPREAVECPMEVLKIHLDAFLCTLLQGICFGSGLGWVISSTMIISETIANCYALSTPWIK